MTRGNGGQARRLAMWCAALMLSGLPATALATSRPAREGDLVRRAHYLMGTVFEISAYGAGQKATAAAIERAFGAIRRSDEVLSHYRDASDLTHLNRRGAVEATLVSPELYRVLEQALRFARVSEGAFDVTVAPLVRLWREAARRDRLPTAEELHDARGRVGSSQVELLPESRARFTRAGVELDLGAIGKGWAVDRAAEVLRGRGIDNAFISAGTSTVYALGDGPRGLGWGVVVRHPLEPENTLATLHLRDAALSTSAGYELSWEIEGRRYSHILDPRTGWPPIEPLLSASVVSRVATEADALSTAVYVLGADAGARLLRRLGCEGLLVGRSAASGRALRYAFVPQVGSLFEKTRATTCNN